MRENAVVVAHLHTLPTGHSYETYEWQGPHDGIIAVSWRMERYLLEFPWRLTKLEEDIERGVAYYIRVDAGMDGWLIEHRLKVARWWRWFEVRLIVTLAVWGLADYHESYAPSWSSVHWPLRKRLRGSALLRQVATKISRRS